jgi:hypothetical protein
MNQKFSYRTSVLVCLGLSAALPALLAGCGKAEEAAATSSSVTIAGSLSGSTLTALERPFGDLAARGYLGNSSTFLTSLTAYSVRCVTLSGTPQAGEGSCDSSGSFSLSIASATNVPIGCFILKGGSIAAIVAFEGTSTGMDGNPVREGAYVAGDGTSKLEFGTITVDLATNKATVVKSSVTGGTAPSSAGSSFADMTGDWTIKAPSAVPGGYTEVCPAGTSNCDGPMDGMTIHLRHYQALDASAGAHYGLSLWESSSDFTNCTLSGGGEGAELPSGWVAQSYGSTTASQLTSALTITHGFPAPTGIPLPHAGFCGASPSVSTCDQISSAGWGFSTAGECQFYCALSSLWNTPYGACMGEFDVDWGGSFFTNLNATNTAYSGGSWSGINSTLDTTNSDYVSYLGGSVKFHKKPKKRFLFNELIVSGSVGTLMDQEQQNRTICVADGAGGCSSNPSCTIVRSNKLTITQSSASSADVELFQKSALAPGANSACASDSQVSNELGETKWFFKLQK